MHISESCETADWECDRCQSLVIAILPLINQPTKPCIATDFVWKSGLMIGSLTTKAKKKKSNAMQSSDLWWFYPLFHAQIFMHNIPTIYLPPFSIFISQVGCMHIPLYGSRKILFNNIRFKSFFAYLFVGLSLQKFNS